MIRDPHREKAAEIFGVPLDKVTPDMRRYAKLQNYVNAYSTPQSLYAITQAKLAILKAKAK